MHNPSFKVLCRSLLTALLSLPATGCVTLQTSPQMPLNREPLTIEVVTEAPGLNDIPIGTYRAPDSVFAVRRYQEISKTQAAFGLLGAMSAHGSGKDASQAAVAHMTDLFKYDVSSELTRSLTALRRQGHGASLISVGGATAGRAALKVQPWVYITTKDGVNARVSVYLKTRLYDKNGSQSWWTRYIYYGPQERPLKGAGSWADQNGSALKAAIREGLDEAGKVLLRDARGADAGWANRPAKFRVSLPGIEEVLPFDGMVLQETGDMVTLSLKTSGAAIFYGINIVPKRDVQIGPL